MTSSTKTNSTVRFPSSTYPPIPKIIEFRRYTAKKITEMLKNDRFLTHLMTSSLEKKNFRKKKNFAAGEFYKLSNAPSLIKIGRDVPDLYSADTHPRTDGRTRRRFAHQHPVTNSLRSRSSHAPLARFASDNELGSRIGLLIVSNSFSKFQRLTPDKVPWPQFKTCEC